MAFSIVAESGIIEEACKTAKGHAVSFPVFEISVNQHFAAGLYKFLMVSDNHPFFDSFQIYPRFEKIITCVLIV